MSVTAARGFQAWGTACGIKPGAVPDLALVVADEVVSAAAVFTRSVTAAPPVLLSRTRIEAGRARAVLLNSGCANAGTGPAGMEAARRTTAEVANALGCGEGEVLACSTGPIGAALAVEAVVGAVPGLVSRLGRDPGHGDAAAGAILTTDSCRKQAVIEVAGAVIGGMAKGSGMVRPDMATMLAVLTTDIEASPSELTKALGEAVASTFNCLNVDGCQSTNDTVVLMASGHSGVRLDADDLVGAVRLLCADLACQMAADAEGASKVVSIRVSGADSDVAARLIGMGIADSALVRSSFFGADPNWGRVFAAVGVVGVSVDPGTIEIAYQGTVVCREGRGADFDDGALGAFLQGDFEVSVNVGSGSGSATILTTDLTPDYVRFNGARS